jgi:septal ring-binding cell division protein DamX/predicted  nucleic acid-binding Zn-ribbon protein
MAQKKNSTKDLEKRVVKLKKKVAALSKSLNKKQSDLSRVLSSVQKKVDKLRKLSALPPPPAPQKKRVQKLRQKTESILGRLKDLEQTVSIIERASDQLRERTDALESRAAEAMHRGGDVFKPAGPPGEGQQLVVDQLRDRAQAMEKQLGQLSGAQEGLELQVALLSREAEDGDDPTPAGGAAGISGERSKALLSGQKALRERVEQLEQSLAAPRQDLDAADARDLARQIPELQTQWSQTEKATSKLNRRAEVLESHYETLVKKDEQISALLEAMERRLKALAPLLEKPETAPPKEGLPKTLAQQIALLSTDRSLNQTRIDEVVKRAEDLEKTGFSYTRHTDALADRIKRLDNRLDSLKTEDRLNDVNRRGDTLERALEAEKERLDEVQRAGQQTDGRLDAVVDDIAVLQDRVQELHSTGEQLDKVVGGLGEEFSDAGRQAKQQQDLLQAHTAQLEKQREDQVDAVASSKKANQALGSQLAALDEARQAQQDAADSLRVQQVRHEHDTQNLQKQLKQRTLAGLLLLLLAAGALVYLFTRGATLPQDIQSLMQAGTQADGEAATAITGLEKDMDRLRQELSKMGDSLAQVSHSVDLINAAETPEPGAEAGQFAANVASLEQQDREQAELLRQAQAEQQQRHAEWLQGQQQLQQQDIELQKDQEALRTELERVAAEVEVLGKRRVSTVAATRRTVKMLAMTPLGASPEGNGAVAQIWSQAQAAGRWTLQMGGFHRQDSLSRFVQSNGLEKDTVIHQTWFQGKKWYVVLHGIFDTVNKAKAAAAQLPPGLVAQKPWVRGIPPVGELYRP